MNNATIMYTVGRVGSGKTYVRCARFILDEWLASPGGTHYSNFPINAELMAAAAEKRYGITREVFDQRVQVIPELELEKWRRGTSGPWEYFKTTSLDQCHIAIDECHVYCGKHTSKSVRQQWQNWLAEIRHMGCSIEFISQTPHKVAKEITNEAVVWYSLTNGETRRDPFFRIQMKDWYELIASWITGEYRATFWLAERRDVDGKPEVEDRKTYPIDPAYFSYYDSHAKPLSGSGVGVSGCRREYQERGKLSMGWWFFRRNAWRVCSRAAVLAVFMWFMAFGGNKKVFDVWLNVWNPKTGYFGKIAGKGIGGVKSEKVTDKSEAVAGSKPALHDSKNISSGTRVVSEEDMTKYNDEIKKLKEEIEVLEAFRRASEEVGMLTRDAVTFRDGLTYAVGEDIEVGVFAGRKIKAIQYDKRTVVLDDGTKLRMKGLNDAKAIDRSAVASGGVPGSSTEAGIQRRLPAVGGPGPDGEHKNRSGKTGNGVGVEYADRGALSVDGGPLSGLGGDSRRVGRQEGNLGGPGSAGGVGLGNGGETFGVSANKNGPAILPWRPSSGGSGYFSAKGQALKNRRLGAGSSSSSK
jgi:hypothetical protein